MKKRKIQHWLAKNKDVAEGFCSILGILIIFVMSMLNKIYDLSDILCLVVLIVIVIAIFFSCFYIQTRLPRLMDKALNEMEKGNLSFASKEFELLLTYKMSDMVKQIVLMNYAVVLRNMGEYDKVYEILSSIHIEKHTAMLPAYKCIYYNNLMDICFIRKEYHQAKVWYLKATEIYNGITKKKLKKILEHPIKAAEALDYFIQGEFDKTIDALNRLNPESITQKIEDAMLYAMASLELGDKKTTREKLEFIIENGKERYRVIEAKEMLKSIEEN